MKPYTHRYYITSRSEEMDVLATAAVSALYSGEGTLGDIIRHIRKGTLSPLLDKQKIVGFFMVGDTIALRCSGDRDISPLLKNLLRLYGYEVIKG